ncbi:unnamed protein product, partial [Vitis vinifera]
MWTCKRNHMTNGGLLAYPRKFLFLFFIFLNQPISFEFGERSHCECAVCLNEFQEEEKLRIIPNCSHIFHIDCIDVWLQSNANCPLCRTSISTTPRIVPKKARKFHHVASMGDECIDTRGKDDQFSIQPIRRSFSMDSSNDRQLYLAIQEILQQNRPVSDFSPSEGCSSRFRRSFFSFGHGRGSRSAVLPIPMDP